jgi:hypothetical protein
MPLTLLQLDEYNRWLDAHVLHLCNNSQPAWRPEELCVFKDKVAELLLLRLLAEGGQEGCLQASTLLDKVGGYASRP